MTATLAPIDADRLARQTLELVAIESPSGGEGPVAEAYAAMLTGAGLDVEIDRQYPESPSVIARMAGGRPGPTLQLAGHLDTVSSPHAPASLRDGRIHGRGACDMKGGLAGLVEVAAALSPVRAELRGSLLITAYGQHEEPVEPRPLHAPLHGLLERGIHGDACIIPEGPHLELPLAGRGLVIFRVWFRRPGTPVHELLAGDDPPPNPLRAAQRFLEALERANRGWDVTHPLAGGESYFVGAVRGGDLYNRIPTVAEVWGTRRYPTGRTADEVTVELESFATAAASDAGAGIQADVSISRSGQPFAIAPDERIVGIVEDAYAQVTGRRLRRAGLPYTGDVSHFANVAGVPAIYHGTDQATAHADHESVTLDDLVRCTRVVLAAATRFLGVAQ